MYPTLSLRVFARERRGVEDVKGSAGRNEGGTSATQPSFLPGRKKERERETPLIKAKDLKPITLERRDICHTRRTDKAGVAQRQPTQPGHKTRQGRQELAHARRQRQCRTLAPTGAFHTRWAPAGASGMRHQPNARKRRRFARVNRSPKLASLTGAWGPSSSQLL